MKNLEKKTKSWRRKTIDKSKKENKKTKQRKTNQRKHTVNKTKPMKKERE